MAVQMNVEAVLVLPSDDVKPPFRWDGVARIDTSEARIWIFLGIIKEQLV